MRVQPRMALSGDRSSCEIRAINSSFMRPASSDSLRASLSRSRSSSRFSSARLRAPASSSSRRALTAVFRREEDRETLADYLLFPVTEDFLRPLIPTQYAPSSVDREDRVIGHTLDHKSEKIFAIPLPIFFYSTLFTVVHRLASRYLV